ncbi:hypothetical protein QQZ08_004514 [Neonectria magnoliae]|uniref:Uncharacterized protein n=1 Tax=Neonectria magnoliae TaxID=2732573 RepID=A0ABR1I7C9_9HYPO
MVLSVKVVHGDAELRASIQNRISATPITADQLDPAERDNLISLMEKQEVIQSKLNELEFMKTHAPGLWMIDAPVAVAAAVAINYRQVVIPENSRFISVLKEGKLWGLIGIAIDAWSQVGSKVFRTELHDDHGKFITRVTQGPGGLPVVHALGYNQYTEVGLLIFGRLNEEGNGPNRSRPPSLPLMKQVVGCNLTFFREPILKSFQGILAKLENRNHNQVVVANELRAFISVPMIRVLPGGIKTWLHDWCTKHAPEWLPHIQMAASQDLSVFTFVIQKEEIVAYLAWCDLRRQPLKRYWELTLGIENPNLKRAMQTVVARLQTNIEVERCKIAHMEGFHQRVAEICIILKNLAGKHGKDFRGLLFYELKRLSQNCRNAPSQAATDAHKKLQAKFQRITNEEDALVYQSVDLIKRSAYFHDQAFMSQFLGPCGWLLRAMPPVDDESSKDVQEADEVKEMEVMEGVEEVDGIKEVKQEEA